MEAMKHGDDKLLALQTVETKPCLDEHVVTARAIHDLCQSMVP
jgi:hypothetical protein